MKSQGNGEKSEKNGNNHLPPAPEEKKISG
jgi:hypothetical protein